MSASFTPLSTPEGPGAGHWVAEQAPEELLATLTAFLARTVTEGESTRRRSL